jgi:hypothetical protein
VLRAQPRPAAAWIARLGLHTLCAVGVFLALSSSVAWAKRRPGNGERLPAGGEVPRAEHVQAKIPAHIEMHVGERQSFKGVNAAGTVRTDVVRPYVSGGVLTILALSEGEAEVMLFGTPRTAPRDGMAPSKIAVTVRR